MAKANNTDADFRNSRGWKMTCRRNARISAWRKANADKRRDIMAGVVAAQAEVIEAWMTPRIEARDRLVIHCVELQTSSLRDSRKHGLMQLAQWLTSGRTLPDLAQEWDTTTSALQKRIQRARQDLDAHGACEDDLFMWKHGGKRHNKPVMEAPRHITDRIQPPIGWKNRD